MDLPDVIVQKLLAASEHNTAQNAEILQRLSRMEERSEWVKAQVEATQGLEARVASLEEERERQGKWSVTRLGWLNSLVSSIVGALLAHLWGHR